ncbi:hypothetical protein EDD15DRAFT_2386797 [Pisolithus albus]|nr:hypothetical protein EDD15DRAFT_2386797 [Pisolithus albus]
MSTSSLVASRSVLPLRIVKTAARYSTATDANATNAKREVIRRMLYPPNVRNRPSPTGSWRPDRTETIERAWKLYQRHLRKKRDAELERKFECMRKAVAELEDIDPTLFREANKTEDPRARKRRAIESRVRGLFPRELKVPTDTPSKDGWQHEWRPFDRPLH